jgi:hypothetical protein
MFEAVPACHMRRKTSTPVLVRCHTWNRTQLDLPGIAWLTLEKHLPETKEERSLLATGLFEQLEMSYAFGIPLARRRRQKHSGLITILPNALAQAIQFRERHLRVGISLLDSDPQQPCGIRLVFSTFLRPQDLHCLQIFGLP